MAADLPTGEIEIPMPLGSMMYQPQQIRIAYQGQISLLEDVACSDDQMLVNIIAKGGIFNAKV